MPRAPRIEFEDAAYHVMARGNRHEAIVFEDSERRLFVETFSEACEMTGWEVFVWVLMDNHYHAVFRTPHANLVEGMKWFQNAYFTKRALNAVPFSHDPISQFFRWSSGQLTIYNDEISNNTKTNPDYFNGIG